MEYFAVVGCVAPTRRRDLARLFAPTESWLTNASRAGRLATKGAQPVHGDAGRWLLRVRSWRLPTGEVQAKESCLWKKKGRSEGSTAERAVVSAESLFLANARQAS